MAFPCILISFQCIFSVDEETCRLKEKPVEREPMRLDTRFNKIKYDHTFSDVSTAAPTRFNDMGYLMYGYDSQKGNVLTYKGFDPGFRHPLFDYGKIENYELTLDGRHTQPPGTMALPAQACTATFRKKTITTVEDLQTRQASAYSEGQNFGFDGKKGADAIPDEAAKNPKVGAVKAVLSTIEFGYGSGSNKEFQEAKQSASREDSTSIFAEAECNLYKAKLNVQVRLKTSQKLLVLNLTKLIGTAKKTV